MKKEKEKKIPTGSIIYLLHTHFNGETYSFIGNKQTFGDERTTRTHFEKNSDGEFFLRTEACQEADNYIVLLSEDEAKDYVAHYGTVDDYETMFGSVED